MSGVLDPDQVQRLHALLLQLQREKLERAQGQTVAAPTAVGIAPLINYSVNGNASVMLAPPPAAPAAPATRAAVPTAAKSSKKAAASRAAASASSEAQEKAAAPWSTEETREVLLIVRQLERMEKGEDWDDNILPREIASDVGGGLAQHIAVARVLAYKRDIPADQLPRNENAIKGRIQRCKTALKDTATFSATLDALAVSVPTDFASVSLEVMQAPEMMGKTPSPPRSSYAAILGYLQSQSPGFRGANIRVGGSSADASVYLPDTNVPLPVNATYRVTDDDLKGYAQFVALFNGTVTVDTVFRYPGVPGYVVNHTLAAAAVLGWTGNGAGGVLESIEIGNEPDLYHEYGVRPRNWTLANYYSEYGAVLQALQSAGAWKGVPEARARVQGATYCCAESTWGADLPTYLEQFNGPATFRTLSYHRYPDTNNANASVAKLLSDVCSAGAAQSVAPFSAAARAAGVPFVIGEGNSVNGGGLTNISNVYATALWSADVLLQMAAIGARRWNFHGGPGQLYAPVIYPNYHDPADAPDVKPLFYGMLTFTSFVANQSTVYAVTGASSNPLIKCWAARDGVTGQWRYLLIHKDMTASASQPASVTLAPPPGFPATSGPSASVLRVVQQSGDVYAQNGTSWGGITWDGSTDGHPKGQQALETLAPSAPGAPGSPYSYAYRLQLQPLTMAIVAFQ